MHLAHGKFWFRSLLCLTEAGEGPSYLPVLRRSHPLPKKQQVSLSAASALGTWWWTPPPAASLCLSSLSLPCRAQEGTGANFKMWFLELAKAHPYGPPAHAPSSVSTRGKWLSCATTTALELCMNFSITEFLWQFANWQHKDKKKDLYEVYQVLVGQNKPSSS